MPIRPSSGGGAIHSELIRAVVVYIRWCMRGAQYTLELSVCLIRVIFISD